AVFFLLILLGNINLSQRARNIFIGIFFSLLIFISVSLFTGFDSMLFDSRFWLVSFAGFLGGPIGGGIAILIASVCSFFIGNYLAVPMIGGIILSGVIGIYLYSMKNKVTPKILFFAVYGIILSIIGSLVYFVISMVDPNAGFTIISVISVFPITTIVATVILGTILDHEISLDSKLSKISSEKTRNEELAFNDKLTNIPNRNAVIEKLKKLLNDKAPFFIAFMDLDNFKLINDTHGHAIGDEVLIAFSSMLKKQIEGRNAFCGRLGGDEFVIVLIAHTKPDCIDFFEAFVEDLTIPFQLEKLKALVNASVGIASYPEDASDLSSILKRADIVMYESKKSYGSNYTFYEKEMFYPFERKLKIEDRLRIADIESEFFIHLQPQISVSDSIPTGFEALLRWNNPALGHISPNEFIPIAESVGYISNLGKHVIDRACFSLNKLQEKHQREYKISINTSMYELSESGYIEFLMNTLKKYKIKPELFELEITERIMLEMDALIYDKINMLQKLGIKIALDDFGIGLSSIQLLKKVKFDTVKIDKEFVQILDKSDEDKKILAVIVDMLSVFKVNIIAEGVETTEQFNNIFKNKIKTVQGYYTGKPEDLYTLLERFK
ncbi:MAG: EAL domain-containing protein, partial [Clostridia bacterium]|nr:EAL domain-containing protein [Clostridia bacterium]